MSDKTSTILEGLNPAQREAVSCVDGPVLIVAGAGSGKTRVLTGRIAYLLEKECPPERILALTFTKKAATEMKERIAAMVGERKARRLWMGTFHSVFIRFLREFSDRIGYKSDFTIYDRSDSESAVKACVKELGLDDKIYKPRDVLSRISMAKNNLYTPEKYRSDANIVQADVNHKKPRIFDIYRLYAEKCRQSGVMDFDDILMNMNILLKDNPSVTEDIASRFDYIMVDEYQDTNYSQYIILKKLSSIHKNLCVVGDDSQSIYAFRGAKIENILKFRDDYPDYKIFRLEQNYRSTKTIVDAANSLIAKNEARIEKKCFSQAETGDKIRLIKAYTEQEEALLIVSSIMSKLMSASAQYRDFAILYRTNSQSRALEEALRRRNLPYIIYSGNSFFERAEVKDVMAYFKLVTNVDDDESFKRIVNKPARGIGDTSLAAVATAASVKGCTLFRAACSEDLEKYGIKTGALNKLRQFCSMIIGFANSATAIDAGDLAVKIAVETGILNMYKEDNSIEGQAKAGNVEELLNSVKVFVEERQHEYAEEMMADMEEDAEISAAPLPVVTLGDFLENVSLLSAVDVEDDEDGDNKISLMTVHSSKGLEFPYVYVAGLEENLFPSGGMLASASEIEEERRLFYVAITRAMKSVELSFAATRMRNGKHESNPPSRFIREIDKQYILNPLDNEDFQAGMGAYRADMFRADVRTSGRGAGGFGGGSSGASYGGRAGAGGSRPSGGSGASFSGRTGSGGPGSSFGGRPTAASSARNVERTFRSASQKPADADFIPSPVMDMREGQRVEHNRFGKGTIKSITGDSANLKAVISFDDYGEKILMLHYAKMRILDQ